MIKEPRVPLFKLVKCISRAIDLVSPVLVGHHLRVAYIALNLADEIDLSPSEQDEVVLASLLHDLGALSLDERIETLEFETVTPQRHCDQGYNLLHDFPPLARPAALIKHHHTCWNEIIEKQTDVPIGSQLIYLADRVEVLINKKREVLGQVKMVCELIKAQSGKMFNPDLADAFLRLAAKECFWFETVSPSIDNILQNRCRTQTVELNQQDLLNFAKVLSRVVDFRSAFTSTHSSGVAAVAVGLAELVGMSNRECQMMKIAGYVHDLGKLAVPTHILEKPGRLDAQEIDIMRSHAYFTHSILEEVEDLEIIRTWAAFHHERLDGRGYPFHVKGADISLGSRILAVADVFTALTEDRPYRRGMGKEKVEDVISSMAGEALDPQLVTLIMANYDQINELRATTQSTREDEYSAYVNKVDLNRQLD